MILSKSIESIFDTIPDFAYTNYIIQAKQEYYKNILQLYHPDSIQELLGQLNITYNKIKIDLEKKKSNYKSQIHTLLYLYIYIVLTVLFLLCNRSIFQYIVAEYTTNFDEKYKGLLENLTKYKVNSSTNINEMKADYDDFKNQLIVTFQNILKRYMYYDITIK